MDNIFLTYFSHSKVDGKPRKTRSEAFDLAGKSKTSSCGGVDCLLEAKIESNDMGMT